ncbi:putative carbonic anhydrase 3 [Lycorma delicatula]|uniref:putative carbonic anhydrase 3 n=1 Tax=Lycorma delicatula TaxID=130591 RepID=UPI003F5177DA
MWIELIIFSMYNEELEALKQFNGIGVTLVSALVIVGTFLMLEVIDWINKIPLQTQIYETENEYGYGDKDGPSEWVKKFPLAGGSVQSPINIDTAIAASVEFCDPLVWENYDKIPLSMTVTNTRHTVQLTGQWPVGSEPRIHGGALGNKSYVFQYAFFRWGASDYEGSEHTVDYEQYPLEMQLQHINTSNPNDIVFLSFLFEISRKDNFALEPMFCKLFEISFPGLSTWIYPFPLSNIHSPISHDYYTYYGSLTNPPCTENILWVIFPEPIGISSRQIDYLRKLHGDEGRISINSRPVQPLNNREIYFYGQTAFDFKQ